MNVLITGGAGFLGAHLAEKLLSEGHSVVVYDDLSRPGSDAVARRLNERFDSTRCLTFIFRDVRNDGEISRALDGIDTVVHCATAGTEDSVVLDPHADFQVRVGGTLSILEAIRRCAPDAHFLLPSTVSVYGAAPVIEQRLTIAADERFKAVPHTAAGAAALAAEAYTIAFGKSYGLKTTVMRFSTLYGGEGLVEDEGWVGRFVAAAKSSETFTAPVELPFPVDILHIADATSAIRGVLAMSNATAGQLFNVGGGARNAPSLRQVAARIEELGGRILMAPPEPSALHAFVLDPRKLRSITGWQPVIGWREGITRAMGGPSLGLSLPEQSEPQEPRALVAFPRAEGLA